MAVVNGIASILKVSQCLGSTSWVENTTDRHAGHHQRYCRRVQHHHLLPHLRKGWATRWKNDKCGLVMEDTRADGIE